MQVAALCYANRNLTDGFIPGWKVPALINLDGLPVTWQEVVQSLLEPSPEGDAPLWDRVEGGYQIHDYLTYQPSREKVEKERREARERMEELRHKRRFEGNSTEVRPNIPPKFAGSSLSPVPDPVPPTNSKSPSSSVPTGDEKEEEEFYRLATRVNEILGGIGIDLALGDSERLARELRRLRVDIEVLQYAAKLTKKRARRDRLRYFNTLWQDWMQRCVRTEDQARAAAELYAGRGP